MEKYFASLPTSDLIRELSHRIDDYYTWVLNTGRLGKWRTAYNTYHGQRGNHNSSFIRSAGDQGELSFLMCNDYRNLVQHLVVTATQQRPATECIAANTDASSQSQAILGDALLETYFKEKKIEKVMRESIESALAAFDVAYTFPMWNPLKGKIAGIDPDTGQTYQEGDVEAYSKTPLEVILDFSNKDANRNDWVVVKDQRNKFDLAAAFPEKAERIINLSRDKQKDALFDFSGVDWTGTQLSSEIDVYTFMHAKTPAVKNGRMLVFFKDAGDLWVFDGPLPYEEIPMVRVCPTERLLSKFGYSNTTDLLSLQDVLDAVISATVTNITATGVNNFWSKKGDSIDYDQLGKGMALFQSEFKPETLMLNEVNPQILPIMNFIIDRMQTISGVNAVARGNIQRDMSGSAMALVQSMAIQFNSGVQAAMTHQIEETGTFIVRHLQSFAFTERLAVIAGKSRNYMTKYFSGKDISKIDRVMVRQGNSYMDTIAGRQDVADKWLSAGIIKDADDYVQVMQTGKLEIPIEGKQNETMLIRLENEALMEGRLIQAIWVDDHPRHLLAHKYLLANPENRKNLALVQAVTQHIQEHVILSQSSNPMVLQAMGIQPIPPTPMIEPMLPSGPAIVEEGDSPDFLGANINTASALELPDPTQSGVRLPSPPKNALTGERVNLQPNAAGPTPQ